MISIVLVIAAALQLANAQTNLISMNLYSASTCAEDTLLGSKVVATDGDCFRSPTGEGSALYSCESVQVFPFDPNFCTNDLDIDGNPVDRKVRTMGQCVAVSEAYASQPSNTNYFSFSCAPVDLFVARTETASGNCTEIDSPFNNPTYDVFFPGVCEDQIDVTTGQELTQSTLVFINGSSITEYTWTDELECPSTPDPSENNVTKNVCVDKVSNSGALRYITVGENSAATMRFTIMTLAVMMSALFVVV